MTAEARRTRFLYSSAVIGRRYRLRMDARNGSFTGNQGKEDKKALDLTLR